MLVCVVMLAAPLSSQSSAQFREFGAPVPRSLDDRVLRSIYQIDDPAFGIVMEAADVVAYPAFYGAVPAAWAGAVLLRDGRDYVDAYLLTLSLAGAYTSSTFLKELIRRPRPTLTTSDPRLRGSARDAREDSLYPFSMPSGHAALAFTLATSFSLSHSEWYVVAPSFAWATATAVSRVWRGRHYPSDVLAGIVLGSAIAGALHLAAPQITPRMFKD